MNSPHRRSDAQEDTEGVLHVLTDCGFLGERESEEQVAPVLEDDAGDAGSEKGNRTSLVAKRTAKFIDQFGHNTMTLRCVSQQSRHWRGKSRRLVAREARLFRRTASGRKSVQRGHRAHGGACGRPGQNTDGCVGAPH